MGHITGWGWYWVSWIFVGFLAPELYWVFVNAKNTLSDKFWGFEGMDTKHPFDFAEWLPVHYAIGIVLLALFFWLLFHLIFGLWG
jgi:hypothetical protein